jgi:hypothetical protein
MMLVNHAVLIIVVTVQEADKQVGFPVMIMGVSRPDKWVVVVYQMSPISLTDTLFSVRFIPAPVLFAVSA